MQKNKLIIAYTGTRYGGWQTQPNAPSIQATLEKVLGCAVHGSGRTDAGVHAKGQVAHFEAEKLYTPEEINAFLPTDIRILDVEKANPSFHARFSAKSKLYEYCLALRPSPLHRETSLHIRFDPQLLKHALSQFVGTHDFTSLTAHGTDVEDKVRTIDSIECIQEGHLLKVQFRGKGFLYKMIRNIMGTALEIAQNKPHDIPSLLQKRDRTLAGKTAPAHALTLLKVFYV